MSKVVQLNFPVMRCSVLSSLFLCLCFSLHSQNVRLEGKILDQKTEEPIPFASIYVESSGLGSIANRDGDYVLSIASNLKGSLKVGSVGYTSRLFDLDSFMINPPKVIYLEPSITQLEAIIVAGKKSKEKVNAAKIVKKALNNLENNLSGSPLMMQTFYRRAYYITDAIDTQYLKLDEAALSIIRARQADQIKVEEFRSSLDLRNEEYLSSLDPECARTEGDLNQIIKADYLNYPNEKSDNETMFMYLRWISGFNQQFSRRHRFQFEKFDLIDNDLVYVIKILPKGDNPNPHTDFGRDTFIPSGKLIIREKDWGVLDMEYAFVINPNKKNKANFYYQAGRLFYKGDVVFKDRLKYVDHDGRLVLKYFSRDIRDDCAVRTGIGLLHKNMNGIADPAYDEIEDNAYYRLKHEFFINEIQAWTGAPPQASNNRVNLPENTPYNEAFWKHYNILPINRLETKYLSELTALTPLLVQFRK